MHTLQTAFLYRLITYQHYKLKPVPVATGNYPKSQISPDPRGCLEVFPEAQA